MAGRVSWHYKEEGEISMIVVDNRGNEFLDIKANLV